MSAIATTFFEKVRQLAAVNDNDALWNLAVTHASTGQPSSQLVLSYLGRLGLELVSAWYHVCTRPDRDAGTVTTFLGAFMTSPAWIDSMLCADTKGDIFKLGKGVRLQDLSLAAKRHFIAAALGTAFYYDTLQTFTLVQEYLLPYYPTAAMGSAENPKSLLQAFSQQLTGKTPLYKVVTEEGPDHDKHFVVHAAIPNTTYSAKGTGRSKKLAEVSAAYNLLTALKPQTTKAHTVRPTIHLTAKAGRPEIATWCKDMTRGNTHNTIRIRREALRFVHFFRGQTHIDLPTELATVALAHASSNMIGPRDTGLTVLGSKAYEYTLGRLLLHEQTFGSLTSADFLGAFTQAVSGFAANKYKLQLATGWENFICTGPGVERPLTESIILDSYDGSLGAATLCDLRNLDLIAVYLCERLRGIADFSAGAITPSFLRGVTNIARSHLQQIYHYCFPDRPLYWEQMFVVELAGPAHSQEIIVRVSGDTKDCFVGYALTKTDAINSACEKALAWISSYIIGGAASKCGVEWLDSVVRVLRTNLVDAPSELAWRTLPISSFRFQHLEFWHAMSAVVRNRPMSCALDAIRSISSNTELTDSQRQTLTEFVSELVAEQRSINALYIVQSSIKALCDAHPSVSAQHAVAVVCSVIYLLKAVERHVARIVMLPDVVRSAASSWNMNQSQIVSVAARLAFLEVELFTIILQQLSVCRVAGSPLRFMFNEVSASFHVMGDLCNDAMRDHGPVLQATWNLCDVAQCGFSVSASRDGFDICIPILSEVPLDGLVREASSQSNALTHVQNACVALHEIKNRMLASPGQWLAELQVWAGDISKMSRLMRA